MWLKKQAVRPTAAIALSAALALGGVPAAFAADGDTPNGTVTGQFGSGCKSIQVDSSGWPAGTRIQVRWYASATTETPGVDGSTLIPAGEPWSMDVSLQVRGFSYRAVDAAGEFLTPLKEMAASCVVVVGPAVSATKDDCDTVTVTATGLPRRTYQGGVDVVDETGAVVATRLAAPLGPGADGVATFETSVSATLDLPTGHTYKAQAFMLDAASGKKYVKVTSGDVALVEACPVVTPPPTTPPTTTPTTPTMPTTPAPTTPAPTTPAPTTPAPAPTNPVPTTPAPVPTTPTTPTTPSTPAPTKPATPAPTQPSVPTPAPTTPEPPHDGVTRPGSTVPATPAPTTPPVTKPGTPAVRMVTRTFQVDRYVPRTAAQARVVARLDDDGRLRYREDRALWGRSTWQFVTVRVPANASNDAVAAAINARTGKVGDLRTGEKLGTAKAGRAYTMAWELGRGATARKPWGSKNTTAQAFFGRS